eukprot:gene27135-35642_t
MIKLRTCNIGGWLNILSHDKLNPILPNETRWSGKFAMLKRYIQLEESGHLDNIEPLQPYVLTPGMKNIVQRLFEDLKIFEEASQAIQRGDCTIANSRNIFDILVNMFPHLQKYLSSDSRIIRFKNLENAIIKLQNDPNANLSEFEIHAMSRFRKVNPPLLNPTAIQLALAQRKHKTVDDYVNLSGIKSKKDYIEDDIMDYEDDLYDIDDELDILDNDMGPYNIDEDDDHYVPDDKSDEDWEDNSESDDDCS